MIGMHMRAALTGALLLSLTAFGQHQLAPANPGPLAPGGKPLTEAQVLSSLAIGSYGISLPFYQSPSYLPGELPFWQYNVVAAQDGKPYNGFIIGSDPVFPWSSTVSVPVIPVKVVVNVGPGLYTWTFDPTVYDPPCLGVGQSAYNLMYESPIFTSANYLINGKLMYAAQYGDAIQRAEFWNYPGGLEQIERRITLAPAQYPTMTINLVSPPPGTSGSILGNPGGRCGGVAPAANAVNPPGAFVVVNSIDAAMRNYMTSNTINSAQFPFFVTYKALPAGALGYHYVTSTGQTYGVADFEPDGYFGAPDVMAASHEINEWINDPLPYPNPDPNVGGQLYNNTPPWGQTGQVYGPSYGGASAACQNNFEVGDPLSFSPPIIMPLAGFNFHLQEMAFFDWYYGGTSSHVGNAWTSLYGAGGKYSSAGTFQGPAILCPPGGTNPLLTSDGGFETPVTAGVVTPFASGSTLGPWSVVGTGSIVLYSNADTISGLTANVLEGVQAVTLAGGTAGVQQTFPTTAGQTYTLTFWQGSILNQVAATELFVNGVDIGYWYSNFFTTANAPYLGVPAGNSTYWADAVYNFVAGPGTTTTIKLTNNALSGTINGLDAVSVTPYHP